MILIAVTLCLIFVFLWTAYRFFTWLLLFAVKRFARIDIKAGRIGFLKWMNVSISLLPGAELEIEKICLSSYYINKNYKSPIVVRICDPKLNLDFASIQNYISSRSKKSSPTGGKKLAFLRLLPLAKFVGFDVSEISLVLTNGPLNDVILQVHINQLTPLITSVSSNSLTGKLTVDLLKLQLLPVSAEVQSQIQPESSLASLTLSHVLEVELNPSDFKQIECVSLSVLRCSVTSTEAFLRLLLAFPRFMKAKAPSHRPPGSRTGVFESTAVPKNILLNLNELEVILQRDLALSLSHLRLRTSHVLCRENMRLIDGHCSLLVKGVSVKSGSLTLLAANQMQTVVAADETKTDVDVQLAGADLGYEQVILNRWVTFFHQLKNCSQRRLELDNVNQIDHNQTDQDQPYNFPPTDNHESNHDEVNHSLNSQPRGNNVSREKSGASQGELLFRIFGSRTVKLSVDTTELSAFANVGSCRLEAGASSWKTSGTFRPVVSTDSLPRPRLDDVQYDLDMTTVYCRLVSQVAPSGELSAKQHMWGTLFYASVIMAKGNRFNRGWSHDVMVDSLRLEASSSLLNAIDTVANAILGQWLLSRVRHDNMGHGATNLNDEGFGAIASVKPPLSPPSPAAVCHVQLTNFNLFLCCDNKAAAIVRIDSVILQKRSEKSSVTLSEAKVTYFIQTLKVQPVLRSADLQDSVVLSIRSTNALLRNADQRLEVNWQDGAFILWTTGLHMCFHQTFSHIMSIVSKYQAVFKRKLSSGVQKTNRAMNIAVSVGARIHLEMHLQNDHRVLFTASEATFNQSEMQRLFHCPRFDVFFDGHDVFVLEGMQVTSQECNSRLRSERASVDTLEMPTNRGWTVAFDRFQIIFPYEYNFADCFQELKNINKWRKIIHKKSASAAPVRVPPDLLITAKSVLVQLSDDPFEVKLRHIYETQCGVGIVNEKRQMAMDLRVDELQRVQGIIPAKKIKELYSLLNQRTSEDYVQRINLLYEDAPLRTSLFAWTMKNVEIFALADSSYSEKEQILKHMKEIDPESPMPDDGSLQFVSLFCRTISANAETFTFQFRDFPHSLLDINDLHVWGRLIGAEPHGTAKARRSATIDMGAPWGVLTVERNMPQMKFFHDFSADVVHFNMAYGPCWEPSMAQVNLSMNKVSRPSVDPSPPLPFWDKFRLLLHGRLTISIQQSRWLYHASLNPYNTTEFMDWTWSELLVDWTNGKWILHGNLDVFSKTASKYNDCRLLHLPNLRLSIRLEWLCDGNPNDHHSVMPSAPEKILEYDIKDYDSYRLFRSKSCNVGLNFEIRAKEHDDDVPSCLFFASTLRWIDKIKMCMNRISRPIRRGPLFHTVGLRKKPISRHFQNVRVSVDIPKFQLCYWVSFSKQNGAMIESDRIAMNVSLTADRRSIDDGLKHRPALVWSIRQFKSQLNGGVVWLCCMKEAVEKKKEKSQTTGSVQRSFLLSVDEVTYEREQKTDASGDIATEIPLECDEPPLQKVKVFNLRASWTPSNRNVAFSLYDGYSKAQTLKSNLLSDVLKGFKVETNQTPKKNPRAPCSDFAGDGRTVVGNPFSPQLRNQSGPVYCLLQQLIKEAGSVAVHEELSGKVIDLDSLQGITASKTNDVACTDWDVEFFNSQVMLKGCETSGYIIVSAAKTSLLSRSHHPFWSDGQLKTKTTLVGSVECMQYYATVDSSLEGSSQNVRWLSKDDIEDISDPLWDDLLGLAGMAGSGQSVGGVVSDTISSESEGHHIQLQRIISRCGCQFFCAFYGEVNDEPLQEIPIPPTEVESDMMKRQEGVDAFTLVHNELKICTNSLQYATILDIVNNLLLYVDPKKKEVTEKLQNMRFKRTLSSAEDQRTPISQRQDTLRKLVSDVRTLERELYLSQRNFEEDRSNEELYQEIQELQQNLEDWKEQVNMLNEELAIMVSVYKESLLQVMSQRMSSKTEKSEITVRCIDLYFQHAEWRMTEADGQIGIADLVLSNFLYTNRRTANMSKEKSDSGSQRLTDSGSHHLELGWFKVTNLLPNSVYTDVLVPQDPTDGVFTDRQLAFRVFCEFASPVGGISVKRHFEVNVAPLSIQLTTRFYTTVMAFFFPGKPVDSDDELDSDGGPSQATNTKTREEKKEKKRSLARGNKLIQPSSTDIDKMKERAANNNLFVYIKIPEVPLRVSYKSENEKLIPNIHDFRLVLPLLEYHNQTWMWHDLAMAIKSDCKKVIVRQVVKHKLHIKSRSLLPDVFLSEMEEDETSDLALRDARKAQALFGAALMDVEEKPSKKKHLVGKHNK